MKVLAPVLYKKAKLNEIKNYTMADLTKWG